MQRKLLTLRLVLLLLGVIALATVASADDVQVTDQVSDRIRVVDGDTIELNGMPIRIQAIDTPETWKPRCPNEYRLGLLAKQRMQQLMDGGAMTYTVTGFDRFGRILANVQAGGTDVGETLLREGHALPYVAGPVDKARRLAVWCPADR